MELLITVAFSTTVVTVCTTIMCFILTIVDFHKYPSDYHARCLKTATLCLVASPFASIVLPIIGFGLMIKYSIKAVRKMRLTWLANAATFIPMTVAKAWNYKEETHV